MTQKERMVKIRQIAGWLERTTLVFHNAVIGNGPAAIMNTSGRGCTNEGLRNKPTIAQFSRIPVLRKGIALQV
jgi:hypothetical protein